MHWALLDTGVYIGHWEAGLYGDILSDIRKGFVVRHSAVVLSELRRGARTRQAQRLVEDLFRLARTIWEPNAAEWWGAGKLVRCAANCSPREPLTSCTLRFRRYNARTGDRVGPPASDTTSLNLVVVSVKQTAARCRILETSEPITLRATGLGRVVPGEILAVRPRKRWTYAKNAYLSRGSCSRRRFANPNNGLLLV